MGPELTTEEEVEVVSTIQTLTDNIGKEDEKAETTETTEETENTSETTEENSTTETSEESTEDEATEATTPEAKTEEPETEEVQEPLRGKDLIRHLRKLHTTDAKTQRQQADKISQLQSELETREPAQQTTQQPTQQQSKERIAPADIFRGLVEVKAGDRSESDLPLIYDNINKMSTEDLSQVMDMANRNAFGALSSDVLAMVKDNVPTVMLNESKRKSEFSKETDWKKSNLDAWDDVRSIPGMDDPKSQVYKDFVAAETSLLNQFPGIKLQADAPLKVLEHMDLMQRATSSPRNASLEKENASLRKQLNIGQGGLSGEGTVSVKTGETKVTPEQQFLIDIGAA